MLDPTSSTLDRYLTFVSQRQRIVAANIANADTPGYKTRDIDFEHALNGAVSSSSDPQEVSGLRNKDDGNNVDLDREARLLAENALRFSVASNLLHGNIKQLRMAIDGGGSAA